MPSNGQEAHLHNSSDGPLFKMTEHLTNKSSGSDAEGQGGVFWVHAETDSTFARGEKEELVWIMNNGDAQLGHLQKVLCFDLHNVGNGAKLISEVRNQVCGNTNAINGLQRHTHNKVNLYSWVLPSSNSVFYFSMSLAGGVIGNSAFSSTKNRALAVDSGCWMLNGGMNLPSVCGEIPGVGTKYFERLFQNIGRVTGNKRPDALILAFSGRHFFESQRSLVEEWATESVELTLPGHVTNPYYSQPLFKWKANLTIGVPPPPKPKLIAKPWDCSNSATANYTRLCHLFVDQASRTLEEDVKARAARHVEFALRSAKAVFKGPLLWRAPYEPQYDPNREWGHPETLVVTRFQRKYREAAAAVLSRMEDVKILRADRVVDGAARATPDNLHFDGGFQRTLHAYQDLREQTVTHELFQMFLKGMLTAAASAEKKAILKQILHDTNRLYANFSSSLARNST